MRTFQKAINYSKSLLKSLLIIIIVNNQDTSGIRRVTDLLATLDTPTQLTIQQPINQVQLLTQVVLVNQQAQENTS
jgi:hypothetical protein